jgi:hypothetical protein
MSDRTDIADARVKNALDDLGLAHAGWFVRSQIVPWNARRHPYTVRTRIFNVVMDPELLEPVAAAVSELPDVIEVEVIRGDGAGFNPLRPQVLVWWRYL